ncbi:hypothetical protein MHH33_01570 [Paenisporosarcina sp. FSL H8-0542]|uniref:hypothetical protein n=1 Tax=Paenisporosarcina sp. FSL H8-0542 TaxID=2921401 RepID=UPI003159D141
MKQITIVLVAFLLLLSIQPVMGKPNGYDVVDNFIRPLVKKDEKQMRTFVSSDVIIPGIRESTPIRHVMGLPSPNENVRVFVATSMMERPSQKESHSFGKLQAMKKK